MGVAGLSGSTAQCTAPPECLGLSFAVQGWWPVSHRCSWCSMVSPGAEGPGVLLLAPQGPGCSFSTALTSVSSGFNGPAPWKDEIYGWAIKEKLERKIYNFPLKPVIHVINIDVI